MFTRKWGNLNLVVRNLNVLVGAHKVARHQKSSIKYTIRLRVLRWITYPNWRIRNEKTAGRVCKQNRTSMQISNGCLDYLKKNTADYTGRFVTADDTWVHHYTPKTKQQWKQWKHSDYVVKNRLWVPFSVVVTGYY